MYHIFIHSSVDGHLERRQFIESSLCVMCLLCAKTLYMEPFIYSSQQSYKMRAVIISTLQDRKLRLRLNNLSKTLKLVTGKIEIQTNVLFQSKAGFLHRCIKPHVRVKQCPPQ